MMTVQEETRDYTAQCRDASLRLAEDGKLERAVELFMQQMKRRPNNAHLVSDALRVEGLASVSQGADAVCSWLKKF